MSSLLPDGLEIAAVLPREDPRDVLVLRAGLAAPSLQAALDALGDTPAIGTSSLRRTSQLAAWLPGAAFLPIRGNVDTRLRKLDEGQCDALVLAAAGMIRLGIADRISAALPLEHCIPAPGQGIVAVEIRADDVRARAALETVTDREAAASLDAERAVVRTLGGGCELPLGAIALHERGQLHVHAVVAAPDGRRLIKRSVRGAIADAATLGARLGADLAAAGALEILDDVRSAAR
jgi:hydroxymethylbilane synthase